jgi:hypothetical protein
MARLERVQPFEDTQQGLLYEIFGVEVAAGELGETAAGPTPQRRETSFHEHVDRHPVATMHPPQ